VTKLEDREVRDAARLRGESIASLIRRAVVREAREILARAPKEATG
jgi:uncharacterized protein (DUF1778 family)